MSKRILVVEDQADNRQIIRDMLTPTDYEVTEVENGEQARLQLRTSESTELMSVFRGKADVANSRGTLLFR